MTSSKLRKAAVLLRTLDAETAATLLAQLSASEAAAVRGAMRAMGPIDLDEQADVLAEFQRAGKIAAEPQSLGVELEISAQKAPSARAAVDEVSPVGNKRFAFLDTAPIEALAACLAREHAQTIAVVLSHLPPTRAAQALAVLPARTQADAIERLATLGETDPVSVIVLERELAAWVAQRTENRDTITRRRQSVKAILAAADAISRDSIMANLKCHKAALAEQFAPDLARADQQASGLRKTAQEISRQAAPRATHRSIDASRPALHEHAPGAAIADIGRHQARRTIASLPPLPTPVPRHAAAIDLEQLAHFDDRLLNEVLRQIDPNALALALAGSSDVLVDRVCRQMPRRAAKLFRRELRRLGPMRLSDMEAAQHQVAQIAARQLAVRNMPVLARAR